MRIGAEQSGKIFNMPALDRIESGSDFMLAIKLPDPPDAWEGRAVPNMAVPERNYNRFNLNTCPGFKDDGVAMRSRFAS